jgi:hypothetical protein
LPLKIKNNLTFFGMFYISIFNTIKQKKEKKMQENKTILGALKLLFGVEEEKEFEALPSIMDRDPAELDTLDEKYLDVMTQDGMTLRVSDMAVGATCMHVAEDGTETPCEAGAEYVLEDGTKIVIGEEGVIGEIVAAEAEDSSVEVEVEMGDKKDKEMYAEETAEEVVESTQTFAAQSEVETLRQANLMLAEKLDALTAQVEAFAKAPSAEPLSTSTAAVTAKSKIETREERLKFFGSK